MKLPLILLHTICVFEFAYASALPHDKHHEARYDSLCDVSNAYSILKGLSSNGHSFCSKIAYPRGIPTRTRTTTVTVTAQTCPTQTKSKTEYLSFTDSAHIGSPTLSQITITEYASTVVIPSGTYPVINKRAAVAEPANNPAIATPTALSGCNPDTCSKACYSLYQPSTTTTTHTKHVPCKKITETITTTIERDFTVSNFFTVTPPPDTTTVTDVLTTTVPAVCAGLPYIPPGGTGVGNTFGFEQYPYYPHSRVACCAYCFTVKDCVASFFDETADQCELLLHVDGQLPGQNAVCPMGLEDFAFGAPDASGNIFPGPCGF